MRLRNIAGSRERIAASPFAENEPAAQRGHWRERFGAVEEKKLYLEIGMGKGAFLTEMARLHPDDLFVGMEHFSSVLIRAVEKQEEDPLPNLLLLREEAERLPEFFAPGEADGLYLNFSDPWPKEKHAKRRLTSPQFLARYEEILAQDGFLRLKTDNADFFAYSEQSIGERSGWEILRVSRDLYTEADIADNVPTEYEIRFREQGNPIFFLQARRL